MTMMVMMMNGTTTTGGMMLLENQKQGKHVDSVYNGMMKTETKKKTKKTIRLWCQTTTATTQHVNTTMALSGREKVWIQTMKTKTAAAVTVGMVPQQTAVQKTVPIQIKIQSYSLNAW